MIEYLYSRIIVTFAAVAISALVIAATVNSYRGTLISLAEDIAQEFVKLVAIAATIDCERFNASFILEKLPFSLTAQLIVQQQSISVRIGDYKTIKLFENTVNLVEGNKTVGELSIWSNMFGILIESERDIFGKTNRVTLSRIDLCH